MHNGQPREYLPDFVARLNVPGEEYLITEVKGADWDGLTEVKKQATERWCAAVNATGEFGHWRYCLARQVGDLVTELNRIRLDGKSPATGAGNDRRNGAPA